MQAKSAKHGGDGMRDADTDGDLVEFAFESQVAAEVGSGQLMALARRAWSFNTRMGLTGEMRFEGGGILQVVEGPCAVVQPLAGRILADKRHGAIRLIALRRLAARRHAGWSMAGFEVEAACPLPARRAANLHFIPRSRRPPAIAAGFATL